MWAVDVGTCVSCEFQWEIRFLILSTERLVRYDTILPVYVDVRDVEAASVTANVSLSLSAELNYQNEISNVHHCWGGSIFPHTRVSGRKIIMMVSD
jgi:hypothetical protein